MNEPQVIEFRVTHPRVLLPGVTYLILYEVE